MASVRLYPVVDVDSVWTIVGGFGTRHEAVDESVDADDGDTGYIWTTADLDTQTFTVQGFDGIDWSQTVTGQIFTRTRNSDKWVDDTHDIRYRLLLPDNTELGSSMDGVGSTSYASLNGSVHDITSTADQEAVRTGLRLELQFQKTVVGMNDGGGIQVTACEVELGYTPRRVYVT